MRQLFLVSLLGLALAACGDKESPQDVQQVDQALGNDDLIENDLTAIDAITGADARMAKDVDPSKWDGAGGAVIEGGNTSRTSPAKTASKAEPSSDTERDSKPKTSAPAAPAATPAESNESSTTD